MCSVIHACINLRSLGKSHFADQNGCKTASTFPMVAIHTALREKGEILQAFLIPKAGIPGEEEEEE